MADVANEDGVGREIGWVWNKYGKNANAWGYRLATGKACGQGARRLARCCSKPRPPRESGTGVGHPTHNRGISAITISKIRAKRRRSPPPRLQRPCQRSSGAKLTALPRPENPAASRTRTPESSLPTWSPHAHCQSCCLPSSPSPSSSAPQSALADIQVEPHLVCASFYSILL